MTLETKIDYLSKALSMQGHPIGKSGCIRLILTYEAIKDKEGKFNILDAIRINSQVSQTNDEPNKE
jgi:hypothetical protein